MKTKMIRKILIAAGLIAVLGGAGMGQAMAVTGTGTTTQHESMGKAVSDSWITTKVKSEFVATKGIRSTHISVKTRHGVVTLTGHVRSTAEKKLAQTKAMHVKGVKSVNDDGLKVVTNKSHKMGSGH